MYDFQTVPVSGQAQGHDRGAVHASCLCRMQQKHQEIHMEHMAIHESDQDGGFGASCLEREQVEHAESRRSMRRRMTRSANLRLQSSSACCARSCCESRIIKRGDPTCDLTIHICTCRKQKEHEEKDDQERKARAAEQQRLLRQELDSAS